jgi:hypothetical protein
MKAIKKIFPVIMMIIGFPLLSLAQIPASYDFYLQNDQQVSPTVFEFDIYVQNTDPVNVFELALFQVGVIVNPAIVNGGTITASIVAGSSELNPAQKPTTGISFASNCIKLANPGIVSHGASTIIPISSLGKRIARVRLTNTIAFGQAAPNLSFNFTTKPYNTVVFAFNQTAPYLNSNIANAAFFSVSKLTNGILNSALPIELISFSGVCSEKHVDLKWSTATETNNDYFTIEKSSDAKTWIFLTKIAGAGNSNSQMSYSFEDNDPYSVTYYRLTQTDFNGKSETFRPIVVKFESDNSENLITVFPNPFNEGVYLDFSNFQYKDAKISVFDVFGKKISEKYFSDFTDNNMNTFIDLNYLITGLYFIEVRSGDFGKIFKIVKN